jgi:2-polyprenyl-3-methyl-5-hydroxy-6-metoxy-1,4-benzoquinol methylase
MLDTVISPSREALNDQQFGATAALYVQSAVHAAGEDLKQIAAIVGRFPEAEVLDLGCGGGHVSYAVAPLARGVVACDMSGGMLGAVSAEAARRGLSNITTTQAPAEQLPFGDASFDVVVCRHTTHHWPDVRRGMREAARVVKPGGVVIVDDCVAPESAVLDTFLQTFEMLRDPSHVRDYSISEWAGIAAQAGLAISGVTRRPLPLDFEQWIMRQRTSPARVAALHELFAVMPAEVRRHFDIRANDDFTIEIALFEMTRL